MAIAFLAATSVATQAGEESRPVVSIVADRSPGLAASHGLKKLAEALAARGVGVERVGSLDAARGRLLLVAGVASGEGAAATLLKAAGSPEPTGHEALVIRNTTWQGKPALLAVGSDDRGLMYALLDIADRVGWAADPAAPFSEVRDAAEQPYVSDRALSVYTMHRAHFESFFYDEAYWARYLDTLARDRFNTFVLIFGYENGGYFAPPYPYFFDTEDFPGIRVVGITPDQQRRNLDALNRLIRMAHERGLSFTLGIWDHIYRGGVQGPTEDARQPTPGLVWGLTAENLVPYTRVALAEFLRRVPDIDGVQFRMHGESGLTGAEMTEFWRGVYEVVNTVRPGLRLDARAKEFPDSLIDLALAMGIRLRICTKYWAEQMGLPFHPTHINRPNQFDRRHGYADLLRYPRRYPMHWRLWNGGTTRILLWGDPDYVRRFAESTHLYDGQGFEVNEPLATKMQGHPHDEKPFELLRPQYRYYDWEFERYWHFFQVFGRVSYNPQTPPEVWDREFERRFGKEAAPFVERGLHRTSQIPPRLQAYCFPYDRFPMTRGWVEKQRREDLPQYAKAEPSDTEQFLSFADAARLAREGGESARIWPEQTSEWLARAAREVRECAAEAEKRIGAKPSKEFLSTMVDLRILAGLADYHARRIPAGLAYAGFSETHDPNALDEAIRHERRAIEAWEKIVEAAGNVYSDDLMMGTRSAGLSGHWKDELAALRKGLAALEAQRRTLPESAGHPAGSPSHRAATDDHDPPTVIHEPIRSALVGKPLTIRAEVRDPSGVKWVRLRYRSVTQFQDYRTLPMLLTGRGDSFEAIVPAEHVDPKWDFMYFIEVMDNCGNGRIYPDLERETPYIVVKLQRDR